MAVPWAIASVEMQQVADDTGVKPLINNECTNLRPFDVGTIVWSDIVTVGEKIWQIVEAGKPVVSVQVPVAFALPRGLTCWTDLDHWQVPRTQTYEVRYKNYFGVEVVHFRFRLQYTYGGGNDGVGRYLANVTVMPAELNVAWGYDFNAVVEVEQAVNMGSKKDPLAGLELNLKWTVKTVLKESDNSFHFFVQGDGAVKTAE